ncbi:MAG: hypothetical protein Q9171_001692 [Xanthocarpia ochracea]
MAKAVKLGARFPPGYDPGHAYIHHVRHTSIELKCRFLYEPLQDAAKIDRLLLRLIRAFHDPGRRNEPVFSGRSRAWEWYEPVPEGYRSFAGLEVVVADQPQAFKRGDMLVALWGLNEIRLSWPKLDIWGGILRFKEKEEEEQVLGSFHLFYEPGDEERVTDTA